MAVKASDFVKKAKKSDKGSGDKKSGKTSLLDWIGNRRNASKKVTSKGEDDHDE